MQPPIGPDMRERELGDRIGFWGATGGTAAVAAVQQPKVRQLLGLAVKAAGLGEAFDPLDDQHQQWLTQHVARQKQATLSAWQRLPADRQAQTRGAVKQALNAFDDVLAYGRYAEKVARVAMTPQMVADLDLEGHLALADLRDKTTFRAALGLGAGSLAGGMLARKGPVPSFAMPAGALLGGLAGGMLGVASVPTHRELSNIYLQSMARQRRMAP